MASPIENPSKDSESVAELSQKYSLLLETQMQRAIRKFLNAMSVPRMTDLRPGIHVNIVLKEDQRSGKLTRGRVSDILTRGDHPRGIKVRLADGRIGRVQSLCSPSLTGDVGPLTQSKGNATSELPHASGVQDDYRVDAEPVAGTSLFDYVRAPKQKKGKGAGVEKPSDDGTLQKQLEGEFPLLDTALIAAIISDHESDLASARAILSSLS